MSENSPKKKSKINPLMRFAGMATQMGVTITAGALGGSALDEHYNNEKPIWTIVLSLAAIGIALYLVIRATTRLSQDD